MRNIFVAPNGSDNNNGLTSDKPLASLAKAANLCLSGDTVLLAEGVYTDQKTAYFQSLNNVTVTSLGANVTLQYASGYFGVQILNCKFFKLVGVKLVGKAKTLDYADAYKRKDLFDPKYSANGVTVRNSYNVEIHLCSVQYFPGAGLYFADCDCVSAISNRVAHCTTFSPYGAQGISFHRCYNSPGGVEGAVRILAMYNFCYGNINRIPWSVALGGNGLVNEGAGLYNDTTKEYGGIKYTGIAVFTHNTCIGNGGAGIHVLGACPTTVSDNYVSGNQINIADRGEIHVSYSPECTVLDNYAECTASNSIWIYVGKSDGTVVKYNQVFNSRKAVNDVDNEYI
jgi:hypothetical protein